LCIEYYRKLQTILKGLKRNVPFNKDNQLDNHDETDSKGTPIFRDVVSGKVYDSFTHYAIDTELLVTDYGAVTDRKGNVISNTTVDPVGMFNNGQRMIISLDQEGIKSKVKESSNISKMVDDDTSPYVELFDLAKEAGATFSDEVVDAEGYAQITKETMIIQATKNFLSANLLSITKQKFLAHEAIHAITMNRLTDEHRERLLDIDDRLRKAYEDGELDNILSKEELVKLQSIFDAIGNIGDEVLTYAFTNSIYAKALNSVKSETQTKETRTLWDSFMLMIAKIVPNTKLSEVKDIMNEVMGITETKVEEDKFTEDFGEFDDLSNESFDNEGILEAIVSDEVSNYLGSSVSKYMRSKSKGEREFLRSKINDGTIVFNCK